MTNNLQDKLNDIRLIALDLDGTSLRNNHQLSEYSYQILKKLAEQYILVPTSGRSYYNIVNEILKGINIPYVISANGAIVSQNNDKELRLKENLIEYHLASEIIQKYLKEDMIVYIHHNDPKTTHYFGCINLEEKKEQYFKIYNPNFMKNVCENLSDFILKDQTDVIKIGIKFLNTSQLLEVKQSIIVKYPTVNVFQTAIDGLEIIDKNASKGSSLQYLAQYLHLNENQVCAIGDNGNDISMLQYAGLSVCVNNAIDDVKQICDFICDDNDHDGCAKFCAHYFLNLH